MVAADGGLNVLAVNPGQTHHFSAELRKLRMCTVASGRVEVERDGERATLGADSGFVIRPGQSCRVRNPWYRAAKVHCFTVFHYNFAPE